MVQRSESFVYHRNSEIQLCRCHGPCTFNGRRMMYFKGIGLPLPSLHSPSAVSLSFVAKFQRISYLSHHTNSIQFIFFALMAQINTIPFISYHQFLTRPIHDSICTFPPPSFKSKRKPLRETVSIKHPNVHDLSFDELWKQIAESLDICSHDIAHCTCCRGKAPVVQQSSGRSFVLLLCSDLRQRSPEKRSWA